MYRNPYQQPQQQPNRKIIALMVIAASIMGITIYLLISGKLGEIGIISHSTTTVSTVAEENVTTTTINQGAMNFVKFALSDYFIWFWVLVVVAIIFVPFGAIGFKAFYDWANKNWIKPRKGYILVRQKLANDRFREYYILPTGKFVKVKSIDGKELEIPIELSKGWVAFDGNMPLIELDEQGQQLRMDRAVKMQVSQEETTKGWKAAYETGKLVGAFDILEELKKMLLIGIIVLIAVTIIGVYFSYSSYSKSTGLDANAVARAVVAQWNNQTQQAIMQQQGKIGG
jgi:hypothetical protein